MASGGGNEPNLTPFIDLFSVLICFLLMTTAWLQLESMQVQIEQQPPPPQVNPDQTMNDPPPDPPEKKVKLALHLERGKIVAKEDEKSFEYAITEADLQNPELRQLLMSWRDRFTDEKQMVVIHSGGKATYGQLIRLYDFVTLSGWSQVAIYPY